MGEGVVVRDAGLLASGHPNLLSTQGLDLVFTVNHAEQLVQSLAGGELDAGQLAGVLAKHLGELCPTDGYPGREKAPVVR